MASRSASVDSRFSNHQRERAGHKRRLISALDGVPGIGPKTRTALLTHFGDVTHVQAAADTELLALSGVTKRHVAALRGFWSQSANAAEVNSVDAPGIELATELAVEEDGDE